MNNNSKKKFTILTCLASKDLLTYTFRCSVYNSKDLIIYLIASRFTIFLLKTYFLFRPLTCEFVFIEEKSFEREMISFNVADFIRDYNPLLLRKSNWYRQQFFKFEARKIIQDNYVIIDGDTFPVHLNRLDNLKENKIRYTNSYAPIHEPYEVMINFLFQTSKINRTNYISEVFPVNFSVLNAMILDIEVRHSLDWIKVVLLNSTHLLGFSEYQTYATYEKYTQNDISYTDFKTIRNFGEFQLPFQSIKSNDADFVTFESYNYPKDKRRFIYYYFLKPYYFLCRKLKL